jgi:hypothetical protein
MREHKADIFLYRRCVYGTKIIATFRFRDYILHKNVIKNPACIVRYNRSQPFSILPWQRGPGVIQVNLLIQTVILVYDREPKCELCSD